MAKATLEAPPLKAPSLSGMTGVYFVAGELGLRGWIATVTARNAPGADILAVSNGLKCAVSIQVKANKAGGTQGYWLLSKRAITDREPRHFYVFVNFKADGKRPDYYVVPSRTVARNVDVVKAKSGSKSWYSFSRDKKFLECWDSLADA